MIRNFVKSDVFRTDIMLKIILDDFIDRRKIELETYPSELLALQRELISASKALI